MLTTPSGGYLHSYFIHFHFCGCCGRRSSLQLNIACLHFLTESNGLRQRVMHNITELTVGRNFLPVLAVRTHKEFITESHCRFRFTRSLPAFTAGKRSIRLYPIVVPLPTSFQPLSVRASTVKASTLCPFVISS